MYTVRIVGALTAVVVLFAGLALADDLSVGKESEEAVVQVAGTQVFFDVTKRQLPRKLHRWWLHNQDNPRPRPNQDTTTTTEPAPTTTIAPPTTPPTTAATTTAPPPPTTTTPPPPTTTAPPPPPTTTAPPPTTTAPVTTTTSSGGTPAPQFQVFMYAETGGDYWKAVYVRDLPSGAHWLDGDRHAYKCAYMFLEYQGQIVGRVTFTQVPGADYAWVNDKNMEEGVRYYDGSLAPAGAPIELGQCPPPTEAYVPSTAPDMRPTLAFSANGTHLETRNYKTIVAGPGITFRQTSKTANRITVVAYKDGLPVVVVYYDILSGNAAITSDM